LLSADSITRGWLAAGTDQLPRPLEAVDVADLGEQVAGEDRADPEDRLQRSAAPVATGVAAQLGLEQLMGCTYSISRLSLYDGFRGAAQRGR
jgi:hypothetical protein